MEDETNELEGEGIELVGELVVGESMLVDDVNDITTAEDIVNIGVAWFTFDISTKVAHRRVINPPVKPTRITRAPEELGKREIQ